MTTTTTLKAMVTRLTCLCLLLPLTACALSGNAIEGRVLEEGTDKPIPFSAGQNVTSTDYLYPRPYVTGSQPVLLNWEGAPLPAGTTATYVMGNLPDNVGSVRLATAGLWDQFLQPTASPAYTLTRGNYDDMAALLIPRVVGYSAGLINHFFRGRMTISLPKLDALNPSEGVYSLVDVAQTTCLTFDLSSLSIRRIA